VAPQPLEEVVLKPLVVEAKMQLQLAVVEAKMQVPVVALEAQPRLNS
jgi:hypothetical protein